MYRVAIRSRWLWRYGSPADGLVRLFCLPCAGHGASMYRGWANHVPASLEIWALQPPGRENRLDEPALADLPALVREVVAALEPLLDDRPFAFVGHSMGALIAFELTRELRRRGHPLPQRLFLSGQPAPQVALTTPPRWQLPDAMFLRSVQEMNTSLAHDEDYLDAMRFMLPTLRTDFTLCERYRYTDAPPLACSLSVWGGESDPEASIAQLAGWCEQTTATFSLRMFPGDHFFLMTQRKVLVRALVDDIAPLLGREGLSRRPLIAAASHA